MIRKLALCAVAGLAACNSPSAYDAINEDWNYAGRRWLDCSQDLEHVPFAHSGNCIAVAEYARYDPDHICVGSNTLVCRQYVQALLSVREWYFENLAASALYYGSASLPIDPSELERRETHVLLSLKVEELKAELDRCFREESRVEGVVFEPKPAVSPVPVLSIPPRRIEPGTKCIRESTGGRTRAPSFF